MINPNLRNYRIPTYADIPRTEVLAGRTRPTPSGRWAPRASRSAASTRWPRRLANALQDATGCALPRACRSPPSGSTARLVENRLIRRGQLMDTENATDTAATVIIGQKVRAGFRAGVRGMAAGHEPRASQYPGFLGAEISPPTAVQPDWVVVYRFDSVAHVQAWINSATRQERWPSASSSSTAPPPSRSSAAVHGRRIRW